MSPQPVQPAVLAGARRAFARHGYASTTLEQVASEAGLSRVTLHRRGVTKAGLLELLVGEAIERYRAVMWPVLTRAGSGAERLAAALHVLCELADESLDLFVALRGMEDSVFHAEGQSAEAVPTRTVFTKPLERLLIDGSADGSLPTLDPNETATLLFNAVGWTYIHLRTAHRWEHASASAAVIELALKGILPR